MEEAVKNQLEILNKLCKEQDGIYKEIINRLGISEAAFWILYACCEAEKPYSQKELSESWFYAKQTINSAITKLTKLGYVTLKSEEGMKKRKVVEITQEGWEFCKKNIIPLIEAERKSFMYLDEEERNLFLKLFQKQVEALRKETQSIV